MTHTTYILYTLYIHYIYTLYTRYTLQTHYTHYTHMHIVPLLYFHPNNSSRIQSQFYTNYIHHLLVVLAKQSRCSYFELHVYIHKKKCLQSKIVYCSSNRECMLDSYSIIIYDTVTHHWKHLFTNNEIYKRTTVNVDIFKRINFQFTNLHMDLIWRKIACAIQNTCGQHFARV